MLTKSDLLARLANASKESPVLFWLDTSAVYGTRALTLGDAASDWRERHGDRAGGLLLHITPLVFVERNAQERRKRGVDFDAELVWSTLESKQIQVATLDSVAADTVSAALATWFPTKTGWNDAKWERVCAMYGETKPAPSKHLSATVDWMIVGSAPKGCVVVTDDHGKEFTRVGDRASYATVLEAIREA